MTRDKMSRSSICPTAGNNDPQSGALSRQLRVGIDTVSPAKECPVRILSLLVIALLNISQSVIAKETLTIYTYDSFASE